MGLDLTATMAGVLASLRDGLEHIFLVGFPIPQVIEGPPYRVHWQALSLPRISTFQELTQGFRPTNEGAMHRDVATVLGADKILRWLESENWDTQTWWSRGQLKVPGTLQVVIIGAGAIGSALAEMLVRSGIEKIVVIDGENIDPGNIVRHTLTLDDEGKNKANAVANRLNLASPYAVVNAIDRDLDPQDPECRRTIEKADFVIDCTASNEVIAELHAFSWKEATTFVSISIGINSERLYVFATPGWKFSVNQFRQLVNPLIQQDYDSHPGFELPQQDAGCWHPLFPARSSDIWLASSIAVRELEDLINAKPSRAELRLIRFDEQFHREVLYPNAT